MLDTVLIQHFNPLHREGGDPSLFGQIHLTLYFNPLHREGGDHQIVDGSHTAIHYFNPLHREGGDIIKRMYKGTPTTISIHSTARVETAKDNKFARKLEFQSTPPRGWRRRLVLRNPHPILISIHSTARVETKRLIEALAELDDFNPLHREGGDCARRAGMYQVTKFQSTPPRGWRRRRVHR